MPKEHQKDTAALFSEEEGEDVLPPHQKWDHKIKLEPGTKLIKQLIYPLSPEKLEALRAYLNKNRRKRFIQESQSSTGYPILFIIKKDEKGEKTGLQLYINYKKLNNIIIKNSYPLPLINKIKDRF